MHFGFACLKICCIKIHTENLPFIQKYIEYISIMKSIIIYKRNTNDKNSTIEFQSEKDI